MRIVSANIFCLNPRPARAIEAVAAQGGDVTILIEATPRFDRAIAGLLPPRRAVGLTRAGGMPVALHADPMIPVDAHREDRTGWLECEVGGMTLLAVHLLAPYLPWRIKRREGQLISLSRRLGRLGRTAPALAIGDYNTADFENAWARLESAVHPWRRLDHAGDGPRGTWPFGQVWSPVAVDHALAPPLFAGAGDPTGGVRTFAIPGSDHLGLTVDLPAEAFGGLPAEVRRRLGENPRRRVS